MVRRTKRQRRMVTSTVLLILFGCLGGAAWPYVKEQPVFRVSTIRLVGCPDAVRVSANGILKPLIGRDLFDVRAQAPAFVAKLQALPEVAEARLDAHPPNTVVAVIRPRPPVLYAQCGGEWVTVAADGRAMRRLAQPRGDLPQAFGLSVGTRVGEDVPAAQMSAVLAAVTACKSCLGAAPTAVSLLDGGALIVKAANGDVIKLGEAAQLEEKLNVYRTVRAQIDHPVGYIDVSTPSAPALGAAEPADG
jgi:cell division septal protein FtsQ